MHLSDDRLSAYVDGELNPQEAAAAAAHLGECASCTGAVRLFSGLDTALAAAPALSCAAVAPFLSAKSDAELGAEEAEIASAHLEHCADCRGDVRLWTALDQTVAAMPAARPSRRVDEAIAALGRRPVRRAPRLGMTWPLPTLAVVTALTLVLVLSIPGAGPLVGTPEPVLVASLQQQVLDPATNTLYTLDPDQATVSAVDAGTHEAKGQIHLGGKPTALVMNYVKNTLVAWDAANKVFVEISTDLSSAAASAPVDIPGTATSVQVDNKGNFVVAATTTGGSGASASVGTSSAVIATVDGGTGQVQAVRQVDVAPQIIVIDPNAPRVLLVSVKSTVLADAATYAPLASATGGVGAAFALGRDDFAVLSDSGRGATITFGRGGGKVTIGGTPRAVAAIPGGGYAVLTSAAAGGLITVMTGDGVVSTTISAPAGAQDLSYDIAAGKLAVLSATGVTALTLPNIVAASPRPTAQPSANTTATPLPTAPVASPTPTATAAPTQAPVVVAPHESDDLVPSDARPLWPGTYYVGVAASQRPVRVISDGTNLWYLDPSNRVNVLHTATGELNQIAALPGSATVTAMAITPDHVYFLDRAATTLYVLSISREQLTSVRMPYARSASAIAGSRDERLWLATTDAGLVSYDPRSSRIESVAAILDLSAVATDSLGRVWTASRTRQALDMYDPLAGKVTEYSLAHTGSLSSLAVDGSNAVWAGTDLGEVYALRTGQGSASLVAQASVGRPITSLILGESQTIYFVSRSASGTTYGAAVGGGAQLVPSGATEPMFDSLGRIWMGDSSSGGFFVTVPPRGSR